jgi:UDP-N-acetylenolpyruvoylglucosamine reductase
MGTCRLNVKGKLKWRPHKSDITEVRHRGGPAGSSVEATVMVVEPSGWLIEQTGIKQLNLNRRI